MRMLNPVHPGRFCGPRSSRLTAFRDGGGDDSSRIPPDPFESLKCQGWSLGRNGPALREGVRRRYGHVNENAEFLRYAPHAQPARRRFA